MNTETSDCATLDAVFAEAQLNAVLNILDATDAHIDFEPGYRVIYGYFSKISAARDTLLKIREIKPDASMAVDGTKATITIAMDGE